MLSDVSSESALEDLILSDLSSESALEYVILSDDLQKVHWKM